MSELKFYTVNDLIELLGVTRRTIYRYIGEGKLEGVKLGKSWRFTPKDIEDFMEVMKKTHNKQG